MGKEYRVEEVNSGICTCTLSASKTQGIINDLSKKGWTFEAFESVIGRRCGCFPSPKIFIVFSKEKGNISETSRKITETPISNVKKGDYDFSDITSIVCSNCMNEYSPDIVNGTLVEGYTTCPKCGTTISEKELFETFNE